MGRITYNMAGYRAIRKSPGVTARVKELVEGIAADCNASADVDGGYEAKVSQGRGRSRGAVITTNAKAIRDNARNNTIIKQASKSR